MSILGYVYFGNFGPICAYIKTFLHKTQTPQPTKKVIHTHMVDVLRRIIGLRPYWPCKEVVGIIKEVEEQYQANLPDMTVGDMLVFAHGCKEEICKNSSLTLEELDAFFKGPHWRGAKGYEIKLEEELALMDTYTRKLIADGAKPYKMLMKATRTTISKDYIPTGTFVFCDNTKKRLAPVTGVEEKDEQNKNKRQRMKQKLSVQDVKHCIFQDLAVIKDIMMKAGRDEEHVDVAYIETVKNNIGGLFDDLIIEQKKKVKDGIEAQQTKMNLFKNSLLENLETIRDAVNREEVGFEHINSMRDLINKY